MSSVDKTLHGNVVFYNEHWLWNRGVLVVDVSRRPGGQMDYKVTVPWHRLSTDLQKTVVKAMNLAQVLPGYVPLGDANPNLFGAEIVDRMWEDDRVLELYFRVPEGVASGPLANILDWIAIHVASLEERDALGLKEM